MFGPTPVSYTHLDVYKRQFQLCMEQKIPQIRVFAMDDLENVLRVAKGEPIGTVVHP